MKKQNHLCSSQISCRKRILCFLLLAFLLFSAGPVRAYSSWTDIAKEMSDVLFEGVEAFRDGDLKLAASKVNDAYFGFYETAGFEKNVNSYISGARKVENENAKTAARRVALNDGSFDDFLEHVAIWVRLLYEDGAILDGEDEDVALAMGEAAVGVLYEKLGLEAELPPGDTAESSEVSVSEAVNEERAEATTLAGSTESPDSSEKALQSKANDLTKDSNPAAEKETALQAQDKTEKSGQKSAAEVLASLSGKNKADRKKGQDWVTFSVAFGLTMREGLEAILVIAAILAYLEKSRNEKYMRPVFSGALLGVAFSIILALIFNLIHASLGAGASTVGQEAFEGFGMFLAVIVLFWVSNWMLSKSEAEVWERYIQKQVESAVNRGSAMALVFSAFLAVSREGAELILFFQGMRSNEMNDNRMMWLGLLVAAICLVAVYYAIRKLTLRLPLKPFFYFTSILMFILCLSFLGKGLFELQEIEWVSKTPVLWMNGFTFDLLGIYPYYENILAQLGLLLLTLLVFVTHTRKAKRELQAREHEFPGTSMNLKAEALLAQAKAAEEQAMKKRARVIYYKREASRIAAEKGNEALSHQYLDDFADYPDQAFNLFEKLNDKGRFERKKSQN